MVSKQELVDMLRGTPSPSAVSDALCPSPNGFIQIGNTNSVREKKGDVMATEATTTVETWADEFRRASDEDPELQGHGKYYSCSYLMDMEEHQI